MIRFSPLDLLRWFVPTDPQPVPDLAGAPFRRLLAAAQREHIRVLDLRGESRTIHRPPKRWGCFRDDDRRRNVPSRGRARGVLLWEKRTAIMLHCTGVSMRPRRFLGCPCHAAIANDGTIVLAHPLNAYVWHGHAANRFSVGVEISSEDGFVDSTQIISASLLLDYLAADLREHRVDKIAMMAHRNSHRSRPNDPGRMIWHEIAIPISEELDLVPGPVVGSGKPIPKGWKR